jgi:hypothetical protein
MRRIDRSGFGVWAAIASLAILFYALAPLFHGLVHADHEIKAVVDAGTDQGRHHHSPAHPGHDEDCGLFRLYAGHGGHALTAPPSPDLAPAPLFVTRHARLRLDPLPAGAPRGFALGRGPPSIA